MRIAPGDISQNGIGVPKTNFLGCLKFCSRGVLFVALHKGYLVESFYNISHCPTIKTEVIHFQIIP